MSATINQDPLGMGIAIDFLERTKERPTDISKMVRYADILLDAVNSNATNRELLSYIAQHERVRGSKPAVIPMTLAEWVSVSIGAQERRGAICERKFAGIPVEIRGDAWALRVITDESIS